MQHFVGMLLTRWGCNALPDQLFQFRGSIMHRLGKRISYCIGAGRILDMDAWKRGLVDVAAIELILGNRGTFLCVQYESTIWAFPAIPGAISCRIILRLKFFYFSAKIYRAEGYLRLQPETYTVSGGSPSALGSFAYIYLGAFRADMI